MIVHRRATLRDASALFELRRKSILGLAPRGMPAEEAEAWATHLDIAGMQRKLSDLEIWVAELDGKAIGWGAICEHLLEGLYTAPEASGQGVGTGLLTMLEGLIRARGIHMIFAEASSNAKDFYLRLGYRLAAGLRTSEHAWPIAKRL